MVGSEVMNDAAVKRHALERIGGFMLLVALFGDFAGGCGPTQTATVRLPR